MSKNLDLSQLVSNNANVSFNGAILVSGTPVINSSGYYVGPSSMKGDKGTSGTSGTKGQKGDTGQKGSQLSSAAYYSSNDTVVFTNSDTTSFYTSGLKGDKGTDGVKGDNGSKGEAGDKGTAGGTGTKGDTGSKGDKGDKGDLGSKGSKGEQVYTVTYTDANNTLAFSSSDGSFFYANGVKGQKGDFLKGDKGDKGDLALGSITGIVKATSGSASAATAGIDYVAPNVATTFTASQTFSGNNTSLAGLVYNLSENITISASAATGTINYDITTQSIVYYTNNASANWTINFRGSSTSSLNSIMSVGQTVTVTFLATQGGTAYYNNAFQVDGTSVTPKWQGGTAPSAGNASSIDIYSFTIVKTGSAAFTIFASQTKFA